MGEILATIPELELTMQEDLDDDEARQALVLASGEVRGATGLAFDFTEDATVWLNGKGARILLLPEMPVHAVSSIVEAPGTSSAKSLALPGSASPAVEWDEHGVLERIDGGVFARRRRHYLATYDFGFEVVPDDVRAVVLRVAARSLGNPVGVRQETLGRYSYTLAGEQAGVGLYGADLADLSAYMVGKKMREGTGAAAGSGSGS